MVDVSELSNIFRMITPADVLGAQKLSLGASESRTLVQELLEILYNTTTGTLTAKKLMSKVDDLAKKATDAELEQLKRSLSILSTAGQPESLGSSQFIGKKNGVDDVNSTFAHLVGSNVKLGGDAGKEMTVVMSNSAFLSPQVRNAEKVEMFMNFIPTVVASRMVPFLDVEFAFNTSVDQETVSPYLRAPSLLKFVLGNDQSTVQDDSATAKMLRLREHVDPQSEIVQTVSGMEMFTAPQTLLNPSVNSVAGRYVDVLDPFRPLITLQNFSVNVTPTVGLYSYKKATLTLVVHDRSRLSEIADLIRPQVYQNASTAPTLWITYGWRHPAEPGNPYADFINGNMLVREAYGIINTQFSFDNNGQVQLTLSLWTRGVTEMRTLKITNNKQTEVLSQIADLSERIAKHRTALGIGASEGINKEIRGYMVIDHAEHGTFPDMSVEEITNAVEALKKSLNSYNTKIDKSAAQSLIDELEKYYKSSDKNNLDFKRQLKNSATSIVKERFNEVLEGVDPFLPSSSKDSKTKSESGKEPSPFTSIVEALNSYYGESPIEKLQPSADGKVPGFVKKAASFGKLFSVFMAGTYELMDGIDEMQLFFYQFNDKAGAAAGTNIAEFPIDMPVFLDQYREYVERKRSESLTLEEFMKLVVDAQLGDTRAIGYGFRSFFAPYDPANKYDAAWATGREQAGENALAGIGFERGPFVKPAVEVYVETLYASRDDAPNLDLLKQFESSSPQPGHPNGGRSSDYAKIIRVHVFDKTNSPYKLAGTILRGDSTSDPAYVEVDSAFLKQVVNDKSKTVDALANVLKGSVRSDGKIDRNTSGGITNRQIKDYVARTIPTFIYGAQGSAIYGANLASKQDPLLSTVQMQTISKTSGKPSVLQPNGSGIGGLPLRIIPAAMTMTSLGCPLLTYAQQFFVDFNTGTTVDNVYVVTGLTHNIVPGKFESQLTLSFYDAYGKFEGAQTVTDYVKKMQIP